MQKENFKVLERKVKGMRQCVQVDEKKSNIKNKWSVWTLLR